MNRFALVFALFCSGCMASNMTEFAKALGQDPATVCFQLTTIYGQGKLSRTNCTNCDVSCTAEGMAIKSTSPTTNIPVTVTPTK